MYNAPRSLGQHPLIRCINITSAKLNSKISGVNKGYKMSHIKFWPPNKLWKQYQISELFLTSTFFYMQAICLESNLDLGLTLRFSTTLLSRYPQLCSTYLSVALRSTYFGAALSNLVNLQWILYSKVNHIEFSSSQLRILINNMFSHYKLAIIFLWTNALSLLSMHCTYQFNIIQPLSYQYCFQRQNSGSFKYTPPHIIIFIFYFFIFFNLFFIVIQLQLYAFSPLPSPHPGWTHLPPPPPPSPPILSMCPL